MKTSSVGLILLIGLAAPAAFGKAAPASKPAAVPKDKRDPASSGGYFRAVLPLTLVLIAATAAMALATALWALV